ncbi:hypothetical protein [Dysgonomonas sp. 520]|uniref:hypothetical protein n=1 Tax=Dysgonomonas sp. 520 TaxID=2302931 RepID=UPI0013D46BFA|nr:hypothetical protein [Dysgonomonas sp. 520]NDW09281.1 hypothetical protein [Dysgonomonas sp. 520]
MKKNRNKKKTKITVQDYIKAVKKANRDIQMESSIGWSSVTKVHKSKKIYDRKRIKKDHSEE